MYKWCDARIAGTFNHAREKEQRSIQTKADGVIPTNIMSEHMTIAVTARGEANDRHWKRFTESKR